MTKLFLIISTFLLFLPQVVAQGSLYQTYDQPLSDTMQTLDDQVAGPLAALFAGSYFMVFACSCLFFIIHIMMCVWIYRDAQKRVPKDAMLWLLLTLFGGSWIVFLIYFLTVRRDHPEVVQTTQPTSPVVTTN